MSLHRASTNLPIRNLAKREISSATIVSTHKHGHTDVPPGALRRLTALGSQKLTASEGYQADLDAVFSKEELDLLMT